MEMAIEISVFDNEEFEKLIAKRDLRISKALVETILKNLSQIMMKVVLN